MIPISRTTQHERTTQKPKKPYEKINKLARPLALIGHQSRTRTQIKLNTTFLRILPTDPGLFTCSASKLHSNVLRRLGTLTALMPKQMSYKGGYKVPKRVTQEQK